MATRTIRRSPPSATGAPAGIGGKYLSITSFKRDGTGVATPVWFVADGRRLLVMTDAGSFKAKRIRHNPKVMVAPCSATGRPRGEWVPARAEFLPPPEFARAEALVARKYRFDRIFILPLYRLVQRSRGAGAGSDAAVLAITPV
jgi:PPOX class probable F420-dependent enzyme